MQRIMSLLRKILRKTVADGWLETGLQWQTEVFTKQCSQNGNPTYTRGGRLSGCAGQLSYDAMFTLDTYTYLSDQMQTSAAQRMQGVMDASPAGRTTRPTVE